MSAVEMCHRLIDFGERRAVRGRCCLRSDSESAGDSSDAFICAARSEYDEPAESLDHTKERPFTV